MGRPQNWPASIKACNRPAKNAGPEPDSAVTASKCSSFTSSATPSAPSRSPTIVESRSVAVAPSEKPAAISETKQGVLGITRIRRASGSQLESLSRVTPAAIEPTNLSARLQSPMASDEVAFSISCGLTARNRIGAAKATDPLSRTPIASTSAQKLRRHSGSGS